MRKIVLIVIIALVASLSVACVSAGLFGDDVTVKEVDVLQHQVSDDFVIVIVPNTNIDHINTIELQNVKLTYPDQTFNYDSVGLGHDKNEADNMIFDQMNSLQKDYQFEFEFRHEDLKDVNRETDLYHIKGDIVINTTTEDNVVIGHIDTDTTLVHKLRHGTDQYGRPM